MISPLASTMVMHMLSLGCSLKIFPYTWDTKTLRLIKATKLHLYLCKLTISYIIIWFTCLNFRLFQFAKADIPVRLRIMHIVWDIATGFTMMVSIQFIVKTDGLMFFVNSLLADMIPEKKDRIVFPTIGDSRCGWLNSVSLIVLLSSFMLYINPPAHAAIILKTPCAPHYLSSFFFTCTSIMDKPATMLEILPFFMVEFFIITYMIFAWIFNWTFVYLGLAWIRLNLCQENGNSIGYKINQLKGFSKNNYRYSQLLTVLLNDSFKYYLEWFPTALIPTSSLLIFGTIRYTHIDFYSYITFPVCGARCMLDFITLFSMAGQMNKESSKYLNDWGNSLRTSSKNSIEQKYQVAFLKSCPQLSCKAGSLYAFQKSILLISLHLCTELTFNLLVTYH